MVNSFTSVRAYAKAFRDAEVARRKNLYYSNISRRKVDYVLTSEQRTQLEIGHSNLQAIDKALATYWSKVDFVPNYNQVIMLKGLQMSMLNSLYGEMLPAAKPALERRFRSALRYNSAIAVLLPRRAGKTTVQVIFAAACAVSIVAGNTICFNLVKRLSRNWLLQAEHALNVFKDTPFTWNPGPRDAEMIAIHSLFTGQTSVIESLPCGSGQNADVRNPLYLKYAAPSSII